MNRCVLFNKVLEVCNKSGFQCNGKCDDFADDLDDLLIEEKKEMEV